MIKKDYKQQTHSIFLHKSLPIAVFYFPEKKDLSREIKIKICAFYFSARFLTTKPITAPAIRTTPTT